MSSIFQAAATAVFVWIGFSLFKNGIEKFGLNLNFKVAWAGILYWILYAFSIKTSLEVPVQMTGIFFTFLSIVLYLVGVVYQFIRGKKPPSNEKPL